MKVFPNKDIGAARSYILAGIQGLSPSDFADSLYESDWKIIWDIYGKRIDGINWYIKFFIEKDENDQDYLAEVSFHPLEKDLKLNSEVVLRKEES